MSRHVEREILSALIDGELDADQRRMVHEHLQECGDCREAADEFSHIHGMIGDLPRLIAPETFVADVLQPSRATFGGRAASLLLSGVFSGRRRWVALAAAVTAVGITLSGLVVPSQAADPLPVDALIERHVGVRSGVESGADVLIAVTDR